VTLFPEQNPKGLLFLSNIEHRTSNIEHRTSKFFFALVIEVFKKKQAHKRKTSEVFKKASTAQQAHKSQINQISAKLLIKLF
jgi:hypothetical protein